MLLERLMLCVYSPLLTWETEEIYATWQVWKEQLGVARRFWKCKPYVLDTFHKAVLSAWGPQEGFHYSQGSDEHGQQGTGAGRAWLLLELPAQPCCSCLSACPVCCWPLPGGTLCPCSAVSLHPSLLPSSSSRADGWVWWRRIFTAAQALGWFKCAGALAGWAHRKSAGETFPILSPGLASSATGEP